MAEGTSDLLRPDSDKSISAQLSGICLVDKHESGEVEKNLGTHERSTLIDPASNGSPKQELPRIPMKKRECPTSVKRDMTEITFAQHYYKLARMNYCSDVWISTTIGIPSRAQAFEEKCGKEKGDKKY
ncbi:adenine deaminase [Striga asiatica]|uniref:Adenine deaminase n=1 Tax=Striga asiatica TaxID=4170 RepID=A0A5A7Q3Z3_STRAF|nr:adenine deaminase [Striga asiatica]